MLQIHYFSMLLIEKSHYFLPYIGFNMLHLHPHPWI